MDSLSDTKSGGSAARLVAARMLAWVARLALRIVGRGATSLPGKLALAASPQFIAQVRRRDPRLKDATVVLVSATNGKTTTATILARILAASGMSVLHNAAGANLRSGVATVLAGARRPADVVLLEVDEATLPHVAPQLAPATLVLGNLFRDQLDRYGELDTIARSWHTLLQNSTDLAVLYNADDPAIATLVADAGAGPAECFGIDDAALALPQLPSYADAAFCPRCDGPLRFSAVQLGHLGHWECTACGNRRPTPEHALTRMQPAGLAGTRLQIGEVRATLPLPGVYNAYNALAAVATARTLGVDAATIAAALASVEPAFGRFEQVTTPAGGTLTLVLAKNPVGMSEVCRTIADSAPGPLPPVAIALNDGIADGRDVSWIWDAAFADVPERTTRLIATGERAAELAVRLRYAGIETDRIVVQPDRTAVLDGFLDSPGDAIFVLTYTALLATYDELAARGIREGFWKQRKSTRDHAHV